METSLALVDSDLEDTAPLLLNFKVTTIPAALLIRPNKKVIHEFADLDPVSIYEVVDKQAAEFKAEYEAERGPVFEKIEKLLNEHKVIVFMKGTAEKPECGFSEQIMEELRNQGIRFHGQNLFDPQENLRNWIKEYSKWPTIPQLFINGKLIGGLEKTKEFISKDELLPLVPETHRTIPIYSDLNKILSNDKLILFVTSNFEGQEVEAKRSDDTKRFLQLKGLDFKLIDLKEVPSIKKGIQASTSEETQLPILFYEGKPLLAGQELLDKAKSDDNMKSIIDVSCYRGDTNSLLTRLVNMRPLMIFIKGTPSNPQCGFTRTLLGILDNLNLDYGFFNILQDEFIRENLKHYSNWKTYPQVYLKGELVGGLDIIKEMIEEGEFQKMTAECVRK